MGELNAYKILVGRPEGKKPFGSPARRWEDNIKMNLGETGWGGVEKMHLAQDGDQWRAVVDTVMKFRFPKKEGNLTS
jgi:hypothetical protein